MISKFKKESEVEISLTKDQLKRERDSEIEKIIIKLSEEQNKFKKEQEFKNVENEKIIRSK